MKPDLEQHELFMREAISESHESVVSGNGETGCVFAETIVITEDGARRMHAFPTEFQQIPV